MRLILCLTLSSLALAGCTPSSPPEAATPAPVVAVAEATPSAPVEPVAAEPAADSSMEGVSFTIEQTQGDCNPETPYRARVYWNIADPGKAAVAIHAESPTGPAMATHDAQIYSAETDNWVRPGMKFFLVHRPTGDVLATLTSGTETCN